MNYDCGSYNILETITHIIVRCEIQFCIASKVLVSETSIAMLYNI